MKLRRRILLYYSITLTLTMAIVGFVSYYEFREQRDLILAGGRAAADKENPLWETFEIVAYGGLPAVLLGLFSSMLFMKRALRPIEDLTVVLEQTDISNLSLLVPRSGNGDELDRMTAVFNRMKERLGVSFTQAREFTLHASHELKTPLTIMHSTLEQMLGDETLPPKQQERIASTLEEVQRLSAIVDQLAFLAKADADLLSIAKAPVALHELVQDLAEDITALAIHAGITVKQGPCESTMVEGDRMRLRQLLLNLADNAVKHNQKGGSITLALTCVAEQACFEITNTGPALPPEMHSRVFDRFFRGHDFQDGVMSGSGLGLSIASSITKAHGGHLEFEVLADGRTRLTLRLPLLV